MFCISGQLKNENEERRLVIFPVQRFQLLPGQISQTYLPAAPVLARHLVT
jgi:hypothetical protein